MIRVSGHLELDIEKVLSIFSMSKMKKKLQLSRQFTKNKQTKTKKKLSVFHIEVRSLQCTISFSNVLSVLEAGLKLRSCVIQDYFSTFAHDQINAGLLSPNHSLCSTQGPSSAKRMDNADIQLRTKKMVGKRKWGFECPSMWKKKSLIWFILN